MIKSLRWILFLLFIPALLLACTDENSSSSLGSDSVQIKQTNSLPSLLTHYIDVGQGDATLLQLADDSSTYNILIDTGNWNATEVVQYLSAHHIETIDIIAITHPHADHIGQLDKIIENFSVGEVWMNGEDSASDVFSRAMDAIDTYNIDYYEPQIGEVFDIGKAVITVLHPNDLTSGVNDNSLSFHIQYGNISFLYTGDAEQQAEREMLTRDFPLEATILHLGHHGSKTSTTNDFLETVRPEVAIYSAGEKNKYGHPDQEVLDRVTTFGAQLYGTDVDGTIRLETDGVTYSIQTEKNELAPSSVVTNCVDLNEASLNDLQKISHVGAERAQLIINARPFQSLDDLITINGLSETRVQEIKQQGVACIGG